MPRASAALGVALALALLPAGCGSGGPVMGRVSGTVTYQGKPLEKGTISFTPTDNQRPSATGTITNGSYTLQTTEPGDGAAVGDYKVTFSDIDAAQLNTDMPGMPVKIAKSALPKKYSNPAESGKTATVVKGSNKIDFPLD